MADPILIESILTSVKRSLDITEEFVAFDSNIVMHINSTFSTLHQLGVGPDPQFTISDSTAEWGAFTGANLNIELVRTYVFMKVKMVFDPPTIATVADIYTKNIAEMEWRLAVDTL